ncbi:FAD-dependent oxidoreductase [Roseomonas sp. AR75]|uniref:FAD-dependent oxidoreductase n=1 Tax=Roseomonas sp. AR75 TaxID=2562311 RepID=UPI0014854F0F|nr:FAD-dependent oxidoreductase [Roseomonas sp. AR75]
MPEPALTWHDADGAPRGIPFHPGQSVAAALTAAGVRDLRATRRGLDGEGRGLHCGMGVCQDCLVEVDGTPNLRACVTKALPGMQVRHQDFPGVARLPLGPVPVPDDAPLPAQEVVDLLILGGGAGGLSAAIAARRCGLDVLVVEERTALGGQYYKQPAPGLGAAALDAQQAEGAALAATAEASGARILRGAELWGAFDLDRIALFDGARTRLLAPRAMIVAAGSYERPHVVPGWTLPGVMTTGAGQTLWRSHRVLPGRRVLVAGNGPLNIQVACELAEAGAAVVAVAEAAAHPATRPRAALAMAAADPSLAIKGGRYVAALRRRGVPLLHGTVLTAIARAPDGALRATLRGPRGETTQEADAVLLGYGFLPSHETLRALGAECRFDADRGQFVPLRDAALMTTVPGLYAVGDCAGLGGAPAAREEGILAALAVARQLGRAVAPDVAAEESAARGRLARHRRFQAALWDLFAAPRAGLSLATPDTVVCRCEEVTRGEIEAALADGAPALGELKRRTRCGMGRCQGRYCAQLLAEHLAATQGRPLDNLALFAPRAPVKPIAIADIVALGTPERLP